MFTQISQPLSTHAASEGVGNAVIWNNNDHNFPLYSFPEILRDTIQELQGNIKAPIPLVANCVFSAISLACQGIISVRRLDHLVGPVSLFPFTIADSGDRKSATDDVVLEPIREFQKLRNKDQEEKYTTYLAQSLAWTTKLKVIQTRIKKSYESGEPTEEHEQLLADHLSLKPTKPKKTKLIFDNVTPSKLVHSMYENGKHAGLISSEGASILNGKASEDLALLCSLWSGSDIHVDRRTQESFSLLNPRLSIGVMAQYQVVDDFVRRKRHAARNTGFFSRCLMAYPLSTQGTRFIYDSSHSWPCTDKFKDRVTNILNQTEAVNADGTTNSIVLKFSPDAQLRWTENYNCIEYELNPYGTMYDIRDFGSKTADNIARIAALFHYFSEQEGDISANTVDRAAEVMKWYVKEFKRLFSSPPPVPQDQADATLLEAWLRSFYHTHQTLVIKKNVVLQSGPNPLRNKSRLNAALQVLVWRCVVKIAVEKKTQIICMNPEYFVGVPGNGQHLL